MTGPPEPPRLLLAGRPGPGKTTAIARLVELLRAGGLVVTAFLTREPRASIREFLDSRDAQASCSWFGLKSGRA